MLKPKEIIAIISQVLTWLSFLTAVFGAIMAVWGDSHVFWMQVCLTGMIAMVVFYIVEQKSYEL